MGGLENILAHFKCTFDTIPDATVLMDNDRRIIMANPAVEEVLGYKPEEMIGQKTEKFYASKKDFEEQGRIMSQLGAEEKRLPFNVKFRKKNGEIFLSETVGATIRDEEGKVLGRLALVRDISERKKRKEELKEAKENFRTIADFTYDWEYWIDPQGNLLYVSPACERITGYSPEQFINNSELLRDVVVLEDREKWEDHYHESSRVKMPREIQFRIKRCDGSVRWIEHACQPVTSSQGKELGFRASNRDITERKIVEEALRQALDKIEKLKMQLEAESAYLREEIELEYNYKNIVGKSNAIQYVFFKVEQIAKADTTVLILGETGTGKELIARAIQNTSLRKGRPLVKVNCAALPAELIESELFGHEKGSFTGAHGKQIGRFEVADGATIFLDEIGELPFALQAKLLRILQDGEFERLGSPKTRKVDVRVIAATNRDLEADVQSGKFRKDLWYRLNVFPITVPPLRDRSEDIPLLVNHFVERFAKKQGKEITLIPSCVITALQKYPWPGNIRELENIIERAVISTQGNKLKLMEGLKAVKEEVNNNFKPLHDIEREYITRVLNETNWKVSGKNSASEILKIDRSTLRARMKKLGIEQLN